MAYTARETALNKLARKYTIEYYTLYLEEKQKIPVSYTRNSRARSRALIRLTRKHPNDYRLMYEEAVEEGFRRSAVLRQEVNE